MVLFGLVLPNHYFPKNTAEYSFKSTSLLMLQFAYNPVEAFSGLNFFFNYHGHSNEKYFSYRL